MSKHDTGMLVPKLLNGVRNFDLDVRSARREHRRHHRDQLGAGSDSFLCCVGKYRRTKPIWTEVDLKAGTLAIVRQLVKPGSEPIFGPPKNGQSRSIALTPQTVELLKRHKAQQARTRLELGTAYHDHGLVFAKTFGEPLQINNLGQREYRRIIEAAGVRPIKFHGLRHTCATLLLTREVPIHVVAERLGHKRVEMTLNTYAHALPSMQQDAATKLAAVLHG